MFYSNPPFEQEPFVFGNQIPPSRHSGQRHVMLTPLPHTVDYVCLCFLCGLATPLSINAELASEFRLGGVRDICLRVVDSADISLDLLELSIKVSFKTLAHKWIAVTAPTAALTWLS